MNAEESRAIVRRYFDRLLNQRDLTVCKQMLAPSYVDHDAPPDTPPGPGSIEAFVAHFLDEYPNLHVAIEDMVGEEHKVAARLHLQGTHCATGEKYAVCGIVIIHLNDEGQLVERWSAYTGR